MHHSQSLFFILRDVSQSNTNYFVFDLCKNNIRLFPYGIPTLISKQLHVHPFDRLLCWVLLNFIVAVWVLLKSSLCINPLHS